MGPELSMLGIVSVIIIFQSGSFIQIIIFLDTYSPRSVDAINGMFDSSFILKCLSWALSLALQVALPVILLSLVVNITAGYLNRIMPQASFYFLTSPAVMLFGLVLISHGNEFLIRSLIDYVLGAIR
jgi:flagellar biosynthesis protein FliR